MRRQTKKKPLSQKTLKHLKDLKNEYTIKLLMFIERRDKAPENRPYNILGKRWYQESVDYYEAKLRTVDVEIARRAIASKQTA